MVLAYLELLQLRNKLFRLRIYSLAVLTLKWARMCPNCMLFTGCQSYLFFGRFCLLSLLVTWHTPLRGVVGPRLARQALFTWERANLIYTTYLLLKHHEMNFGILILGRIWFELRRNSYTIHVITFLTTCGIDCPTSCWVISFAILWPVFRWHHVRLLSTWFLIWWF